MGGTLRRVPACEVLWWGGGGGNYHTPRAGWGLIFWTMSFYIPKKFMSRSYNVFGNLSILSMYSEVLGLILVKMVAWVWMVLNQYGCHL